MYLKSAEEILRVLRKNRQEELSRLERECPEDAGVIWDMFREDFYSEWCLAVLVSIRHQVERQLLLLAARITEDRRELDHQEYRAIVSRVKAEKRTDWEKIASMLQLGDSTAWPFMELLRVLVNSFKHDRWIGPNDELLRNLNLPSHVSYAPLAESLTVRVALAERLGLGKDSDFCGIASEFLALASQLLTEAKSRNEKRMSKLKWSSVSLNPETFLH